ncbi:MAG: NYN domain-containing protein [Dehalococcoidia bacterium]|nr:NYN domain-containing protein [Dehalococcoidia bacterium]
MVRFFGKPRKDAAAGRTTAARAVNDDTKPARTAASRTVKLEALPPPGPPAATPADAAPERKTTSRRRTTTRPPRRDWAAEAAATPVDSPAPPASSAATGEEFEPAAHPTKRRRGTRGGRGRKKNGATPEPAKAEVAAPEPEAPARRRPAPRSESLTIEDALARQAVALEGFTREVTATLKGLQASVAELQHRADGQPDGGAAHERVGIFVDVPNVIYAAERRGITLDFGKVLHYFTRGRELVRATAYAPISDDPGAKLESQRFAHHFLGHPYRLVTKPLKRFADGSMKANFDIELAVDILTMSDRLDVVVLMSGDGDFRRVVELVASRGVRVEVVAFNETAANELKSVADLYIDLGDHVNEFKAPK